MASVTPQPRPNIAMPFGKSPPTSVTIKSELWVKPTVMMAVLLGAFFLLQSRIPMRTAVQIGADEGFELAKATLCLKGYQLYSDIWCDHPPLHTFILTQVLKHLSPSVLGPRLVTTGFTTLLLTAVFIMAIRLGGLLNAVAAVVLLMASPGFLELSSSCMMEIPALAPAVMALCVLMVGR